jgi:phage N-6-adenine-methyltransferase
MQLVKLDEAKRALAEASTLQEIKDIRDKAEAIRQYVKVAGYHLGYQNQAAETKLRAERKAGELLKQMEKNKGGKPSEKNRGHDVHGIPSLKDLGIHHKQSQRWQQIADLPEESFENKIEEVKQKYEELTQSIFLQLSKSLRAHVANNSGDNEWYTPEIYINAARETLGTIDLDPASNPTANEIVKAKTFYTAEDSGLEKEWVGNVWMNPPYESRLIGSFIDKLLVHYVKEQIPQAIVLVNNATETQWFQLIAEAARASCFPKGRVKFWHPRKEAVPLQGQSILYLGQNKERFIQNFHQFGVCWEVPLGMV